MSYVFHSSILREYDIRGVIGETLSADDAYAIGRAFGSFKPEWKNAKPRIAVGRDGRLSSPALEEALIKGLKECGAEVIRIGIGPTPLLYFAVCTDKLDGGIMITGSHNPPTHNGFKFMLGRKSFYGEDIKKLGVIAQEGAYISGEGKVVEKDFGPLYVETLAKAFGDGRKLKIAWDCGNGATGRVVEELVKRLPGEHTALFTEIDGGFPNHHPDPSVAKNLQDLIRTVRERGCDAGVAFDGDGDRVGVVDETGEIIWGDQLLAIFAAEVLSEHKGATIIADVKASQTLFDEIAKLGGKPLMWKTGHSLIKTKMAETGALIAGEMSGHMFFADKYFGFDDGIYAAVRLIALLAKANVPLSSLRKKLPVTCSTPELRIECEETRKFAIIDEVNKRLKQSGASFSDVDGVRVMNEDGWWLLRASNTQAVLVARCESGSEAGLERLKENLSRELSASGIKVAA
ncbi:MAG TPA: phosphomannomutase/phosphoglucomutase [Rickettsiales bacterium]|nr:phosphomannomutase/phosphoglucomutase [Rickettsiales bacterium]